MEEYRRETGRDVMKDFPHWEVAHKTLMVKGGIPGIENINGDLDAITGKRCTFLAFPWRWPEGEGCGVRVVAILDPEQTFRIETGRTFAGCSSHDPRASAQSPLLFRRARHGRRRHRRLGLVRACLRGRARRTGCPAGAGVRLAQDLETVANDVHEVGGKASTDHDGQTPPMPKPSCGGTGTAFGRVDRLVVASGTNKAGFIENQDPTRIGSG